MLFKKYQKNPLICIWIIILFGGVALCVYQCITERKSSSDELPCAVVMTVCEEKTAQEIEREVTEPVEAEVSVLPGVQKVKSISGEGLSAVNLQFLEGTDVDERLPEIRESLAGIEDNLPEGADRPVVLNMNAEKSPAMILAVTQAGDDTAKTAEMLKEDVVPKLKRIEGVAYVHLSGYAQETIEITLHPEKIEAEYAHIQGELKAQEEEVKKQLEEALKEAEKAGIEKSEEGGDSGNEDGVDREAESGSAAVLAELQVRECELKLLEIQLSQAEMTLNVKQQEKEDEQAELDTLQAQEETLQETYENLCRQIEKTESPDAETLTDWQDEKADLEEKLQKIEQYGQETARIGGALLQIEAQKDSLETASSKQSEAMEKVGEMRLGLEEGTKDKDEVSQELERLNLEEIQQTAGTIIEAAGTPDQDFTEVESIPLTPKQVEDILTAQNFSRTFAAEGEITQTKDAKADSEEREETEDTRIWVGGEIQTIRDLEELPVAVTEKSGTVRLSDVADIRVVRKEENSVSLNGKSCVLLSVGKKCGYSEGKVSTQVMDELKKLEKDHSGVKCVTLFNSSEEMKRVAVIRWGNLLWGLGAAGLGVLMVRAAAGGFSGRARRTICGPLGKQWIRTNFRERKNREMALYFMAGALLFLAEGAAFLGRESDSAIKEGTPFDLTLKIKGEEGEETTVSAQDLAERYFYKAGTLDKQDVFISISGEEEAELKMAANAVETCLKQVKDLEEISCFPEGAEREFTITVNKEAAMQYGLTVEEVGRLLGEQMGDVSEVRTNLSLKEGEYPVCIKEAELQSGEVKNIEEINLPVKQQDGSTAEIPLREIADVEETYAFSEIYRENGRKMIWVTAQVKEGTKSKVIEQMEKELESCELPDGYEISVNLADKEQ